MKVFPINSYSCTTFENIIAIIALLIFYLDRNWLNYVQYYVDTDFLYWTSKFPTVSLCSKSFSFGNRDFQACEKFFHECSWNGLEIQCCQYFQRLKTLNQTCFSLNSEQTRKTYNHFFVSHFIGEGKISVSLTTDFNVFVHDPKEVPMDQQSHLIQPGLSLYIMIQSINTIIDSSAHEVDFDTRQCILPDERNLLHYPQYSKSACIAECEKISNKSQQENLFKGCKCPPNCDEHQVKIIWTQRRRASRGLAKITVHMPTSPKERIILKARYNKFQIFVSMACFSRIFTSQSLISIGKFLMFQYPRHNLYQPPTDTILNNSFPG